MSENGNRTCIETLDMVKPFMGLAETEADMEQHTATIEETPGSRIRLLTTESEARGTPMVSAEAMQTRLFDVYDDVVNAPDALTLVQNHLKLTLERTWYNADEVGKLADQVDWLLAADIGLSLEGNQPAPAVEVGEGAEA